MASTNNNLRVSHSALRARDLASRAGVHKHLGAVLIKKSALFGTIYFLEHRKNDKSFIGHYALYGGTREGAEEFVDSAARELRQETGIIAGTNDLHETGLIFGDDQKGNSFAAQLFILDFPKLWARDRPSIRKIKSHQANEEPDPKDEIGPPVRIRRWLGVWFVNWNLLTPIAAYSLLIDQARSKRTPK